jgi:hypothetical protein
MKKNEFRTKRKAASEANASEADELIKDYLDRNYHRNAKTQKILEDYIEQKGKLINDE